MHLVILFSVGKNPIKLELVWGKMHLGKPIIPMLKPMGGRSTFPPHAVWTPRPERQVCKIVVVYFCLSRLPWVLHLHCRLDTTLGIVGDPYTPQSLKRYDWLS